MKKHRRRQRLGGRSLACVAVLLWPMIHAPGGPWGTVEGQEPPPAEPLAAGAPLLKAAGQLGSLEVWVFDRGKAVARKALAPDEAQRLVAVLEQAARNSKAVPQQRETEDAFPGRDAVIGSGLTLEMRYELPVKQAKLGFVSPNYSRLFSLRRLLIPLTGKYARVVVGDRQYVRLFPYEVSDAPCEPLRCHDWSRNYRSVVYTTADADEIRRVLAPLGIELDPCMKR